jgi:cytochrome c-type biogenesis protein CcmH/NrfF
MSRWKTSVLLLLIVGVSIAQTSDSTVTPAVQRVGSKLACLCGGCRNTIANCPMLGCHSAVPAREKVNKLAQEGKSDDEIIQAFVRETGIQALAVPPATGFNSLVWIMPWVAIALGLLAIGWFMRRHRSRRTAEANASPELDAEVLSRYRDNIEKDMSRLD